MDNSSNKSLLDKALEKIYSSEEDFSELKSVVFGTPEEANSFKDEMYTLARDGMPEEIFDALMGAYFVGFLMGKIYCEEEKNNDD